MKILLTGSNGQLGRAIKDSASENIKLLTPLRSELNLENYNECKKYIYEKKPDWIINCAAYTDVDKAEEQKEIAYKINALAPKALTEAINETKGNILQISTDYVFDGKSSKPYLELDNVCPINNYGYSKAQGEELIKENINDVEKGTILRTSWLISSYGENFLKNMLKLHEIKDKFGVVNDQIGSPTSTKEIALICWAIIRAKKEKKLPFILHWCNSGIASWYDLARKIGNFGLELGLIKKKAIVDPIKTSEYPRPANRPKYSVLNTHKTQSYLKMKPKNWEVVVEEIIGDITNKQKNK